MHLHTPVVVGVVHHHTGADPAMAGSLVVAEEGHTLVAVEVVRNLVGEFHNFLAVGELHNLAVVEEVHNFLAVGVVHNLAVAEVGNLGEEDHILVEALLVQEL